MHNVPIAELKEHPLNHHIYGLSETEDLEASISEHGLKNPILIADTADGYVVVSGHRRLQAMNNLGFEEVPSVFAEVANEEELLVEMIVANEYRSKTPEMRIREGMALEEAEKLRAKRRMGHAGEDMEPGAVRDIIGQRIQMSGKSYEMGRRVVEEIDKLEETDPEAAENIRKALDRSISAAYKEVNREPPQSEPEETEQLSAYSYWPIIDKVVTTLEWAYDKLKTTRDNSTLEGYGHFVGNLMDIRDRLHKWAPTEVEEHGPGPYKVSDY